MDLERASLGFIKRVITKHVIIETLRGSNISNCDREQRIEQDKILMGKKKQDCCTENGK